MQGRSYLAGYATVPNSGWGIVMQSPVQTVYEQLNRQIRSTLLYMAFPFLIIMLAAMYIARKLALPETGAPLPHSLGEALDDMEASDAVKGWLGPVFFEAYMRHKRSELAYVADLAPPELCARYAEVY